MEASSECTCMNTDKLYVTNECHKESTLTFPLGNFVVQ